MTPATESYIRFLADLFPGIKVELQGGFRIVRQATDAEKAEWQQKGLWR